MSMTSYSYTQATMPSGAHMGYTWDAWYRMGRHEQIMGFSWAHRIGDLLAKKRYTTLYNGITMKA